ncbi:hypothetical protein [Bacillus cereus]|uniref:Uncharacterized protein n=1 Tax=Bacillus cereus VD184 TaxID=1053242 RepID=A0A9W5R5Y1_BACCE|nr:hypothetical protein [Bacillus cereus]EOQ11115.1 hypothetical protein IKC_05714 [Bacillus cereus VD184]
MFHFKKISLFFIVILYIVVINLGYIYFVSPSYAYLGYTFSPPPMTALIIATILILVVAMCASISVQAPSDFIFWFLFSILYIPIMYIPLYSVLSIQLGKLTVYPVYITITLSMLGLIWIKKIPSININIFYISNKAFFTIFFALYFSILTVIVRKFGFHFNLVGLDEVYELRYSYREVKDIFSTYAITWMTKCLGPTLLTLGFFKKKVSFVFLGLFSQIMVYSISGHKSVLFSTLLLIVLFFCLKKTGENFSLKFIGTITAGLLLFICIDVVYSSDILTSLFLRRFIVTPGLLLGMYYEFFSFHPKALYAYSIFRDFLENPYATPPAFTIGLTYFGDENVSANANLWADGFANFGIMGICMVSILLIGIAYICNCIMLKFKNVSMICLIIAMPIWALTDTSLLTTITTHGLLINILILYFLPPNQEIGPRGRTTSVLLQSFEKKE